LKLPLNQLSSHLERGLSRIYLVAADEPLLVAEATDDIRRAALGRGFDERRVHFVDRSSRWDSLTTECENLSLFSSRRILELRMNSPRPGDAGAKAIRALADSDDPDRIVIIAIQEKLDRNAQNSVWLKSIQDRGVVVDIRPVERADLPRFIAARAKRKGLTLDAKAAELLADRVEGNLLAADQELTKLALIVDDGRVDAEAVERSVATSARYDVFRLSDAVLAGDLARALQVLDGLRSEDVHPTLVLWSLARDIMRLAALKQAAGTGRVPEALMYKLQIWQSHQPIFLRALGRYSDAALARLLQLAAQADRIVKGAERGPVWETVTSLILELIPPARGRQAA
jgi:DNA polymerase-3 subunit delta